jgi:hypothetical protein
MRLFRPNTTLAALAAAVLLGACLRGDAEQALADDLQRDLDMAGGTAVELAPKAGGQQVVSDLESTPPAPQPRPIARAPRKPPTPPTPQPAATPVLAEVEAPEPEVSAPAPTPAATVEAPVGAGRPTPIPARQKAPPGGWKTPSEVIRNAPFPINP